MNINNLVSNVREWADLEEFVEGKIYLAETSNGNTICVNLDHYEKTGWYDNNKKEYYRRKNDTKQ